MYRLVGEGPDARAGGQPGKAQHPASGTEHRSPGLLPRQSQTPRFEYMPAVMLGNARLLCRPRPGRGAFLINLVSRAKTGSEVRYVNRSSLWNAALPLKPPPHARVSEIDRITEHERAAPDDAVDAALATLSNGLL